MNGRADDHDMAMDDKQRFEMELEFLQCLASPEYLSWLAQSGTLDDRRMVNYLAYLRYWQAPQYAQFVSYVHPLSTPSATVTD